MVKICILSCSKLWYIYFMELKFVFCQWIKAEFHLYMWFLLIKSWRFHLYFCRLGGERSFFFLVAIWKILLINYWVSFCVMILTIWRENVLCRNLTMSHGHPAVQYIDLETCLYGVIETSGNTPVSVSIDWRVWSSTCSYLFVWYILLFRHFLLLGYVCRIFDCLELLNNIFSKLTFKCYWWIFR